MLETASPSHASSRAMSAGMSVGLRDSIRAATPAAIGAEKLVPTEKLKLSL